MEPIFQFYSPMSPVHDEVMESLDNQLEFKLKIIDDLVQKEEKEMAALATIMDTQDRSERTRKRKRTACKGCSPSFKNACLDCKQSFASKKLKNIHDKKTDIEKEVSDLKEKRQLHQEGREMRRPAEIWEEARRKEYEAAQLDADELKQEAMDDDYPQFSHRSTDGDEIQDEDVKMEPSDPIGSIGLPNQIKTEPAEDSPLVNNDVFMNDAADSSLSSSNEDMDSEPANDAQEAANNNAPLNEAPNNADNELPWWFPYNDELDAYINSF